MVGRDTEVMKTGEEGAGGRCTSARPHSTGREGAKGLSC